MIKNYVKRAVRRAESGVEKATGVRARDLLGDVGRNRSAGGSQGPAGAARRRGRGPSAPHGEAGAEPISMPQGLATTSRVAPLTIDDVLTRISSFDGVTGYYYEAKTDIIRIVTSEHSAVQAVSSCFDFACTDAFEIVPVPLSRGAGAPKTLSDIQAELLSRHATRFQLVDERNLSTPFSVQMECWEVTPEGHLASARNNNTISRVWHYDQRTDVEQGVDMRSYLPAAPLSQVQFDIDWVFTWVNGQDPDWQEMYRQWAPDVESDASDGSRFEHRDDLMFALRSLDEYAPWIRRIHVISNCKPPSWLDLSNDRIRWVSHEEVFEPYQLPTFNSHAIETTLHKIPGLAEHFVYSNDDFYLARRACPEDFFASNGLCLSKLEGYGMVNGDVTEGDPDYLNAARNSGKLIAAEYGGWPVQLHTHSPQSLRVSVIEEMEEKFPEEFRTTRESRFREASNIAVTGFMFHHYAYASGRAVPVDARTQLIQQNHNFDKVFASLARDRNRWSGSSKLSFCVNDGNGSMDNAKWNSSALEFLRSYFPAKSQFEK